MKYRSQVCLTGGAKLHITKMVYTKTWHGILKFFFPDIWWSLPKSGQKLVYLTFDDGPDPAITPWLLEVLAESQAKATFFCLGKQVEAHPEIYRKIIEHGHSVGIHGFDHLNGWETPTARYLENIEHCHGLIDSNLFRPPYGKLSLTQYLQIRKKYRIVMWDLMPGDFRQQADIQKMLEFTTKHLSNGTIITLHDNLKSENNLKALLPPLMDYIEQQGFRMKTL